MAEHVESMRFEVTATLPMSEQQLLDAVLELARTLGYLAYHQRPARTRSGWKTAMSGDPGFPDLTLVGEGRVLFVELKSEKGKTTGDQDMWARELLRAGLEVYLWRPESWRSGEIEWVLRRA